MPGLNRVFLDSDQDLALRKPGQIDLLMCYLERWAEAGVEVIALTRGKVEAKLLELQQVGLRQFFEEVQSLEDPKPMASTGDLLLQGLRDEGWVPREQLFVCNSIETLKSIWMDNRGDMRRYTLSHTLRYPDNQTAGLTPELLEVMNSRIFADATKQTKHYYSFIMNGSVMLDCFDSLDKFALDQTQPRERVESLKAMKQEKQTTCLRGRPDLAELLGVAPVDPEPPLQQQQANPPPRAVAKASRAPPPPPQPRGQPPPPAQPAGRRPRGSIVLADVSEGTTVRVGDGPHEGKTGTIVKVDNSGPARRYRVELQSTGSSTWTNVVKNSEDAQGAGSGGRGSIADSGAGAPMNRGMVSPLMAALTGGAPTAAGGGGKGGGKGDKGGPPKASQPKVPDEFPEGSIVECLAGKEKGRCGTVLKIVGEGKEKKYRVQMEAGGGSVFVDRIQKATRALQAEEVKTKITDLYDCEKKKLGAGAFGSVCKVVSKSTKLTRAMKTCPKPMVKNVDVIWKEVAFMKRLDHPNIIKIYDTFEDARNVYLIMEICTGGELFDRILEMTNFTEGQAAVIMQQALRGVFYMHSKRIVHRDLKPENFLLTTKEPVEKTILKIIDFGLAHDFAPAGEFLRTRTGSAYYVAPQVLDGKYTEAADMWSFGVILYVLLCGYPPFEGETDPEIFAKVKTGEFEFKPEEWSAVSDDAKDLIRQMLSFDEKVRHTAGQALKHTWMEQKAPKAQMQRRGSFVKNLRAFQSQNKFKKAALQVIANQMSEQQIKSLRETFIALDANGDGLLTIAELRDGIGKLGLEQVPTDLQQIMEHVDANSSGCIDYTEFISASMDKKTYLQEDVCWAAFRIFDKNGDGKICKEEIAAVLADGELKDMVAGDLAQIMQDCDADGDGEIDFQEFMAMMKRG